jgi:hypothetical protein
MTTRLRQAAEIGRVHGLEGAGVAPAHLEAMETMCRRISLDAQPPVLAEDMRPAEIRQHDVLRLA